MNHDNGEIKYNKKNQAIQNISLDLRCRVKEWLKGTIISLFPYEWYRNEPHRDTGWDENWISFKGEIAKNLIRRNYFSPVNPIMHIGIKEEILELFTQVIERTKIEHRGYQPLISGAVLHLLGHPYFISKEHSLDPEDHVALLVDKARALFR